MKNLSRLLIIVSAVCILSACNELLNPMLPDADEVPVCVRFSLTDKAVQTKSKVSGEENPVHSMQLVCFDANGQYLGIRNASVTHTSVPGTTFFDQGTISGTVPQGTARIHFIANRDLDVPLSHSNGTAESDVMNSKELSTHWNDLNHQEVCYWGYHKEDNAEAMSNWLKPAQGTNHVVYMIRDRAKVVFSYSADPGHPYTVTEIKWLIHNGRARGYLAPAEANWSNDGYHGPSPITGQSERISTARIHEYKIDEERYSLWTSEGENDDNNFDLAQEPQFLFDDDNTAIDDVKVILKVTYTDSGSSLVRYHVLRFNNDDQVLYDIVRNNTYYINCKNLSPNIAYYKTLKAAIEGDQFINADVEVDRAIPDINDETYTLQIKLPSGGTSTVFNTKGNHTMDFVFRKVSDLSDGSTTPSDFDVSWEKSQSFCNNLSVSYNSETHQFTITATVPDGQPTTQLQDEWIVVKHKSTGLTRYIHVYAIDQFRYKLNPTLKKVGNDYVLNFQLPPMEHSVFLPDGSPDPNELVYPESLYPIDVTFATNTLNAYGTTQGNTEYGLFGVSLESTHEGTTNLLSQTNFESSSPYNSPISSTENNNRTHWYYQQQGNYWDFWYTYSLKAYPPDGVVNIYFKDVRSYIEYARVADVGLFLFVEYFGKIYSISVTQ